MSSGRGNSSLQTAAAGRGNGGTPAAGAAGGGGAGMWQPNNNSPAGRGAMGQQQQQPPQPQLAGGPPPLSSLQQQQMMMHGGYDPRYYGGHPPPYGMHAQQMGMMQGVPPGGMRYNPMQQQGPNVGRVGGGPGGYGFVPGGPMMQQGPGIPQQYNNQGGQGRGGVQHYPMVQPGMNRGFAVGGGVVSPTASVPPPREKKVLVITDKNGNPIDFGKGKTTPATSITPSPTTVSGSDAAAAPIDGVASSDAVVASTKDGGVADVEAKVS